jgi:DNA invertase Pin-like site-specific DNA recombinase
MGAEIPGSGILHGRIIIKTSRPCGTMRKKFTEEQIAFALKQAETGTPVVEVILKMGITEQTYYRWKKNYGGLG